MKNARPLTLIALAVLCGIGCNKQTADVAVPKPNPDSVINKQTATATKNDGLDPAKAALEYRDERGWTLLMIAANQGRADVAKALLEKGADPNATEPARGTTATFMAAFQGHNEIIRLLAASGADLNVKSPFDGASAIILACQRKKWTTVKTLVEEGADPVIKDGKGLTPFLYAAADGNTELVQFLESKGASAQGSLETYKAARKARNSASANPSPKKDN